MDTYLTKVKTLVQISIFCVLSPSSALSYSFLLMFNLEESSGGASWWVDAKNEKGLN